MRIFEKKIDKQILKYFSKKTPGMSLLIGKKGKILYKKGFGMADIEKSIPVKTDTSFIIASVTKQFTAMAVMILKEKGLLDYDDTIDKYFPDFPDYKNTVTIRNLMTHTSGIKEYFSKGKSLLMDDATQEDILNWIKSEKELDFKPNTRYSYSNSGYVMLGAIVERASGKGFSDFLRENIFIPLDMKNTTAGTAGNQNIDKLAAGYIVDGKRGFAKTPLNMMAIGWADGNIISTVEDLFKWHNALNKEILVSSRTQQEAFTPHVLEDGRKIDYGFGWKIRSFQGKKEVWHTGETIGYTCRFSRYVDEDIAIIMLTNLQDLARNIRDELFDNIANTVFDLI